MARNGRIARFGVFEVDFEAGELRKSGVRIKLQDQPFQILGMLLDRAGEIVTREELRTNLWPDGTFVDFDHSLNASINKLREALGDTASNARFIETVPRRGYRFIAPVEKPEPMQTAVPAADPPRKRSTRKVVAALSAAILVIAAAGIGTWLTRSTAGEPILQAVPLTSSPGPERQPSFSPDGNYVAYTGGPKGLLDMNVYVKQIGSEAVRQLTSDPAPDVSPKWSPDGRSIAFIRVLDQREPATAAVMIVPALGGAERKLGEINVVEQGYSMLDWFPDSQSMVIADAGKNGNRFALYGLNTRTNERWRLTTPQSTGLGDLEPAVSPDGRRIAFSRSIGIQYMELYVLSLGPDLRPAGDPHVVTPGVRSASPAWTPNGREIVFTAGAVHRRRLWRVQASPGSIARSIPLASEGSCGLSVAISGRSQLAYLLSDTSIDIFRTDLAGKKEVSTPFLNSTAIELLPEYSPDGKRIAFVSTRTGSQQIWLGDSDGSNAQQLTFLTGALEATWPRWSPDGRRLLFTVGRSVYEVSVDGGPPAVRLKDVAAGDAVADWSRDGKWIHFISNRTGTDEIWKTRADIQDGDKETMQVTRTGAVTHRTSYDGRFIYYAKGRKEAELWRVPAGGGPEERVVDRVSTIGNFAVSQDSLYFIPAVDPTERASLVALDTRTQTRRTVAFLPGVPMWGLTISLDSRYVLHSAVNTAAGGSDLMLVENFR